MPAVLATGRFPEPRLLCQALAVNRSHHPHSSLQDEWQQSPKSSVVLATQSCPCQCPDEECEPGKPLTWGSLQSAARNAC